MWVILIFTRSTTNADAPAVCGSYNLLVKHCISIRQCKSSDNHIYFNPLACSLVSGLCFRSVHNVSKNHFKKIGFCDRIKKSSCTRIGARYNAKCCCVTTLNCAALEWTDTVRYLGVYYHGCSQVLLLTPQCQKIILPGLQLCFLQNRQNCKWKCYNRIVED